MPENKKKYWVAILGPVSDNDLPPGADAPLRDGVRRGAEKIGLVTDYIHLYSGWGVTEDQAIRILAIFSE